MIFRDLNQPSCSGTNSFITSDSQPSQEAVEHKSSTSSISEQVSEMNDFDGQECQDECAMDTSVITKNASVMTEVPQEENNINPFHRDLQEFLRYD